MADEDESRFNWNYAGEIKYLDDDGNWVRGGEIPEKYKKILEEHDKKVKAQNEGKTEAPTETPTEDARLRRAGKRPQVRVHIHKGR